MPTTVLWMKKSFVNQDGGIVKSRGGKRLCPLSTAKTERKHCHPKEMLMTVEIGSEAGCRSVRVSRGPLRCTAGAMGI